MIRYFHLGSKNRGQLRFCDSQSRRHSIRAMWSVPPASAGGSNTKFSVGAIDPPAHAGGTDSVAHATLTINNCETAFVISNQTLA